MLYLSGPFACYDIERSNIPIVNQSKATSDTIHYIIQDAGCAVVWGKTGFLLSSILGGRGGHVDSAISELARSHTSLDVVIADSTRTLSHEEQLFPNTTP